MPPDHTATVAHPAPGGDRAADAWPAYANAFMDALADARVQLVAALPESKLKHVYRRLWSQTDIRYVTVTNEAELPGIVAGAYLGGMRSLMMMENSGLRQACEPIARFALSHQVPMVMVVPYRGDLGETNWWGHSHAQTMEPLLAALRVPFWHVRELRELSPMISGALDHAASSQLPVALILGGDCVDGGPR
jgi:sulfopyruvate decarboxylase TPP-binding subunit